MIFTNLSTIKVPITKKDAKPCLRWVLLLQEFVIEIRDIKSTEKLVADHLSKIDGREKANKQVETYDAFQNK